MRMWHQFFGAQHCCRVWEGQFSAEVDLKLDQQTASLAAIPGKFQQGGACCSCWRQMSHSPQCHRLI